MYTCYVCIPSLPLVSCTSDTDASFLELEQELSLDAEDEQAPQRPLASAEREDQVRAQLHDAIRTWNKRNPESVETIRLSGKKGQLSKKLSNASRFRRIHVHIHHAKPKKFDNRALNDMVKRLGKQHKQASTKIAEILYRLKKCAGKKKCLPFIKKEMAAWKRAWIKETQAVANL